MDRNLGAIDFFPTVINPISPTVTELEKIKISGGLQFQWGRKDPIPSFTNPDGSTYDIYLGNVNNAGTITYTTLNANTYNNLTGNYIKSYNTYSTTLPTDKISEKISKNLAYSVKNPLVFMIPSNFSPTNSNNVYYNNGTDWISNDINLSSDRWGRADKKSPFDPCPEG